MTALPVMSLFKLVLWQLIGLKLPSTVTVGHLQLPLETSRLAAQPPVLVVRWAVTVTVKVEEFQDVFT
jgi:hypothetical protein